MNIKYLIGIILCLNLQIVLAQTDTSYWLIQTTDGNEFIGQIVSDNDSLIQLKTNEFGIMDIKHKIINNKSKLEKVRKAEKTIWRENHTASRYFWSPSGYGLRKKEGYYQNTWILFNQVSYGISDYFTLGVGTIPFGVFLGGEYLPIWITPKLSIPLIKDKLNLGVGTILFSVLGDDLYAGLLFSNITLGRRDNNHTFGLGFAYSNGEIASTPILNYSHMSRLNRKWYFITENYGFIDPDGESFALLSGGARVNGKSITIDFGFITPISADVDGLYLFPWLSIQVPIGKKY